MADLTALFGILILLGLSYPCLLAAWRLLFGAAVERARLRLERTPGRCFWLGMGAALLSLLPILILLNLPSGPAKFMGWIFLALLLSLSSVGGTGWAELAGERLLGASTGGTWRLIAGALVSELAAVFPLIGWLIYLPYTLLASLGAACFAVLRWMPREAPASFSAQSVQGAAAPGVQS